MEEFIKKLVEMSEREERIYRGYTNRTQVRPLMAKAKRNLLSELLAYAETRRNKEKSTAPEVYFKVGDVVVTKHDVTCISPRYKIKEIAMKNENNNQETDAPASEWSDLLDLKGCWSCKYLALMCLEYSPNPNFTHVSSKRCPFSSEDMISFHPHGVSQAMLFDIHKGDAWNDGGINSIHCDGYIKEQI